MLKVKKLALLLKTEVTYGTDSTPAEATDAIMAYDCEIEPLKLQTDKRDFALPHFGNQGDLVAGQYVAVRFKVPIAGSGAAGTAPKYGPALITCGLAETISAGVSAAYNPTTPDVAADKSASIYYKIAGRLHKVLGALGNVAAVLEWGKKPYFQFTYIGLYAVPTDAALAALTLTAFQKELAVNNANTTPATLHTFAGKFRRVEFDLGNVIDYRNLANSEAVRYLDRNSTARFQLEDELVAGKDWWTTIKGETLGAWTVTHGLVAGNKVKIDAANVQLLEPSLSSENGAGMISFAGNLRPSNAGNDELSITVL